ncbi:hypothetical protein PISMIDRAFT_24436 [Pisolithus microcarpus 441]|uniref:Uncharacterized protein n=1 Tax=Pisolithus microcarpus 441 TaxID=765257 RepID=A0A0C9YRV1_9AGAM|nr:hypothetical protein BKA83DRAFT_24436 [Pisolithus microcarpus]KIK19386.1 hypothetical protein PISMIDRAFT_24436 [Pisolithus microcarpus 441]
MNVVRKSVLYSTFHGFIGNSLVSSVTFGWSVSNKHPVATTKPFIDMRQTNCAIVWLFRHMLPSLGNDGEYGLEGAYRAVPGQGNKGGLQGYVLKDNSKNTRFSINYFTSIRIGILIEKMREYLRRDYSKESCWGPIKIPDNLCDCVGRRDSPSPQLP